MSNTTACIADTLSAQPRPLAEIGDDKTARVLLIEDDRTTRRMVAKSLKDHCELVEAASASQGISAYNAFQPDLVFMDIGLPDGDGQNLLSWITHNDPGAFVVMFSGHSDSDNIIRSIDSGARGFITKPFDLNKMLYFLRICPKLH
ncbi:MAG: response regulator [Alphaproteobacteria bacterium]|nr:response regulator [Alphaproteobacteria bacterium]